MTDAESRPAPRRPATARPRQDLKPDGAAPPTPEELESIERNQMELVRTAGAEVIDDPDLGASLIRHANPSPRFNLTAGVRWQRDEVAQQLTAVERRMRSDDRWPSIVVSEGLTEPANLAQLLESADWKLLTREQIMFTRHPPLVPHLDPGLRVEAVTAATALEFVRLETANFGLPPESLSEQADNLARAVGSGAVRGFLLRLVGEPVAGARLTPGDGVAGLGGIGVAAHQRRRGYGRLITAVATRAGLATGHKLVWLSVSRTNMAAVDLYRRVGFEPSFAWSRWAAPAD